MRMQSNFPADLFLATLIKNSTLLILFTSIQSFDKKLVPCSICNTLYEDKVKFVMSMKQLSAEENFDHLLVFVLGVKSQGPLFVLILILVISRSRKRL